MFNIKSYILRHIIDTVVMIIFHIIITDRTEKSPVKSNHHPQHGSLSFHVPQTLRDGMGINRVTAERTFLCSKIGMETCLPALFDMLRIPPFHSGRQVRFQAYPNVPEPVAHRALGLPESEIFIY